MKSEELREQFLSFFESKGHVRVPSDTLLPSNDATLLFTSAGMVQFKPLYVSKNKPYTRATSCQRSVRTTDIERVGTTARHLTFFEMLGNFSFGDYFKEDAIAFGWEFLTKILCLDPARLHMSIYDQDLETGNIWAKYPLENPIVRFNDEDNYWPAGSVLPSWSGPNGPCSEVYFDFGPSACARAGHSNPCFQPGVHECDRFVEIWNLVFPQFMRDPTTGENPPMAKPGIDTGMGLERISAAVQGKETMFETDIFLPLIEQVAEQLHLSSSMKDSGLLRRAQRIIADHSRAAAFIVCDGVTPSNEGRGYVLRRIIRRAVRQTALFGEACPVVSVLIPLLVSKMSPVYPELEERAKTIIETILAEEVRFIDTLQRGLEELEKERGDNSGALLGDRAFYLYDTFGFPRELTVDIWTKEMKQPLSSSFDVEYENALEAQQGRARAAWKGSGARTLSTIHHSLARELGATKFVGYEVLRGQSHIAAVIGEADDGRRDNIRVKTGEAQDTVEVVLASTPFYAQSGGQVSDMGRIVWDGGEGDVLDVQKPTGNMFIHTVRARRGIISKGITVHTEVDSVRRHAIERNHTATHLLHAALHKYVGRNATQAGSLVSPERLRFDFMAARPVDTGCLRAIELFVNEAIIQNIFVKTSEVSLDDAKRKGAMMLFSEKYGTTVRIVEIGEVSRELCGGTHVLATGAIGPFVILSESGVASGVRRIEAISGLASLAEIALQRKSLDDASAILHCTQEELEAKITKLIEDRKRLAQTLKDAKALGAKSMLTGGIAEASKLGGISVLITETSGLEPAALREMADNALSRLSEGVVVMGSATEGRAHILARVSKGLISRVSAIEIVNVAASTLGGSGGGKPEMAQAGGKNPEMVALALTRAREFLAGKFGN